MVFDSSKHAVAFGVPVRTSSRLFSALRICRWRDAEQLICEFGRENPRLFNLLWLYVGRRDTHAHVAVAVFT